MMQNGSDQAIDCSRWPVFRLLAADGEIDRDFGQPLVGAIAGRGLRLLIVSFPAVGAPNRPLWATVADGCSGAGRSRVSCLEAADDRHALPLLTDLARHYDLVLVDGDCRLPLNTLQLGTGAIGATDAGSAATLRTADPRQGSVACAELLLSWLDEIWRAVPVWACVLIGGRSSRMGRPKHLLEKAGGRTWLEDTVEILRPHVERVVLAGQGEIPPSLRELTRIADVPDVVGPLAGILAAMRWQPDVTWLLVACDMPSLTFPAVEWLLDERRPGRWAVMPHRGDANLVEPLFACYDRRCRSMFEELRLSGCLRIGMIIDNPVVHRPVIPEGYHQAWDNINTPSELELYRDSHGLCRELAGKDDR